MDKKCKKCEQIKEMSAFPKNRAAKSGFKNWCKTCEKNYYDTQEYREKHRETHRKYRSKPETQRRIKDLKLKMRYGITHDEYDIILIDQNYSCAICGCRELTAKKNLSVDHNHKTGKVRGLVCHKCNTGLGNFKDDPKIILKAFEYLTKSHKCTPSDNPKEAKDCTDDQNDNDCGS